MASEESGSVIQCVRAWNEKHWNMPLALTLIAGTIAAFAIVDPFGTTWTERAISAGIGLAVYAGGELVVRRGTNVE